MTGKQYTPSGKTGSLAWLCWLWTSAIALPLAGGVYAFIIWWIPFTILNPFITVLFGLSLTVLHNLFAIEYGHVRNLSVARWMGHLAFLIAMIAHWIIWLALTSSMPFVHALVELATNPQALWDQFVYIIHTGTWWGPGGTWSGKWLVIAWIIEAALIYFPFIKSVSGKARQPYSETNQSWFEIKVLPPLPLLDADAIDALKNDSGSTLISARKTTIEGEHSLLTLFITKGSEYYISIDNKVARPGGNPMTNLRSRTVLEYWHIGEKEGHHLHQLLLGTPCYLKDESFKTNLIKQLKFNAEEIKKGETRYKNINNDTLRNRFVWVDKVWHPRLGQVYVDDLYGTIPRPSLVALIWFIQHEPLHEQKSELARKLSGMLSEESTKQRAEVFIIAFAWYKSEPDSSIKDELAPGLKEYPAVEEKKEFPELHKEVITTKMRSTEFSYLCRPGYGSNELLIEIDGAEDEFFLQDFLNIISEMHPRGNEVRITDMHDMLSSGDVEWNGHTDFGKISFHQNVYGTAFIHGEENNNAVQKIDSILKNNNRFTREEADLDKYKIPGQLRYKCRPGYGTTELLIEFVDGNSLNEILPSFLNAASSINPQLGDRSYIADLDETASLIIHTTIGDFDFNEEKPCVFLFAETNQEGLKKLDDILLRSAEFLKVAVDPDDYKTMPTNP